ncbi:MAG: hypothetical protein M3680_11765, partial [Myxococcota bacterium]|nr:hypothetical protein [Myxococcota bacterium]
MVEVSGVVWSRSRRIAFRYGVVFAALLLFPFPLGLIPPTAGLAELLGTPWAWGVAWFAEAVLGIPAPAAAMTGSGDTTWAYVQLLMTTLLAGLGAAGWTLIDRRRLAYPRLEATALVALRYFLASMLLGYGLAKVFPTQFPPPSLGRLDQPVGELSPMGLLWTFMGHSTPYTIFSGLVEALAGVLLLWRRTTLLGALIAIAVMTNVVALNLCYDVPVKLFSMELLLVAVLIALPHARRLAAALLGIATVAVAPRVRGSARSERVCRAAKLAALTAFAVAGYEQYQRAQTFPPPPNELHGTWVVASFTADGVERPPLLTDDQRWRKLIVSEYGVSARLMTDQRVRFPGATVDPEARTITLPPAPAPAPPAPALA